MENKKLSFSKFRLKYIVNKYTSPLKIIYSLIMLLFSPITFGAIIPLILLSIINYYVYGEYSLFKFSTVVLNPCTYVIGFVFYYWGWDTLKEKMERVGWDII